MKKYIFHLLLVICTLSFAQTPDFNLYGYAAMNGGTTGGEGGAVVTPSNFEELQSYASGDTPYIILIDREFKGPNVLRLGSNKTLYGVNSQAFFNQTAISIQSQHNIIIRNIRFTMTGVPISNDGENKIQGFNFDPDCIAIQADDDNLPESERKSYNIWVDHCEFFNEDPNVMSDYDRYDGLLDIKNDVQFVTISWNYFHDHHKACLSGKGNSDDYDRKTTMHHNKFENIKSRMPLLRYGKLHMLNNYVTDCPEGNGLNVRVNSNAYVEKNYFDNVKKPIFGKLSQGGKAHLTDNRFIDCGRLPSAHMSSESPDADPLSDSEEFTDSDYRPPYSYNNICIPVNDVPSIVNQYAGVGVIPNYEITNFPPTVSISSPTNGAIYETSESIIIRTQASDSDGNIDRVEFFLDDNSIGSENSSPFEYILNNLTEGIYFIKAVAYDNEGASSVSETISITVEMPSNFDCAGVENGTAYLDDCGVCVEGNTGFQPCASTYEAEQACSVDGIISENTNGGFSGEGYVNTENIQGASAEWIIQSDVDRYATLSVRFANGGATDRNGTFYINSNEETEIALTPTGGWDVWDLQTLNIPLQAGSNRLVMEAVGADGLANLDLFYFSSGISEASCTITATEQSATDFNLYPNPTDGIVYLSKAVKWTISDALGNVLLSGNNNIADLSNLKAGIYFIRVNSTITKIIKK